MGKSIEMLRALPGHRQVMDMNTNADLLQANELATKAENYFRNKWHTFKKEAEAWDTALDALLAYSEDKAAAKLIQKRILRAKRKAQLNWNRMERAQDVRGYLTKRSDIINANSADQEAA